VLCTQQSLTLTQGNAVHTEGNSLGCGKGKKDPKGDQIGIRSSVGCHPGIYKYLMESCGSKHNHWRGIIQVPTNKGERGSREFTPGLGERCWGRGGVGGGVGGGGGGEVGGGGGGGGGVGGGGGGGGGVGGGGLGGGCCALCFGGSRSGEIFRHGSRRKGV